MLTVPQAVEQFGSVLDDEGLTLVVIHLNDKSVEALFSTAPNMRALQLQAKDATMFFVQGTNATSETVAPALEWQLRQGDDVLGTRPINIANFEENSEVPDGERYSGLVVADGVVDRSDRVCLGERGAPVQFRVLSHADRDDRRGRGVAVRDPGFLKPPVLPASTMARHVRLNHESLAQTERWPS